MCSPRTKHHTPGADVILHLFRLMQQTSRLRPRWSVCHVVIFDERTVPQTHSLKAALNGGLIPALCSEGSSHNVQCAQSQTEWYLVYPCACVCTCVCVCVCVFLLPTLPSCAPFPRCRPGMTYSTAPTLCPLIRPASSPASRLTSSSGPMWNTNISQDSWSKSSLSDNTHI